MRISSGLNLVLTMNLSIFIRSVTFAALVFSALVAAPAGTTERGSVAWDGRQGDDFSSEPSLSADGRYLAFGSLATNLVPGDTNGVWDIFVRDRWTGAVERVSLADNEAQANASAGRSVISANGRFVVFYSQASNLVAEDTNGVAEIFVRDRLNGVTERVALDSSGGQANGASFDEDISADGRFVVFLSDAINLVAGDTNGAVDVFVRDRVLNTTQRVSVSSDEVQANDLTYNLAISEDGRYVAFTTAASNLVAGDTNGVVDVFVRDLAAGVTERVSLAGDGSQGYGYSGYVDISADGRYVAFESYAGSLAPDDTNGNCDIFVRDRLLGTTERVSLSSEGAQALNSSYGPTISPDGRYVGFYSEDNRLVAGDANFFEDVFLHDRVLGTTELISQSSDGEPGNQRSYQVFVSAYGRFVAFHSEASNLVPGDTNNHSDVFVRDRGARIYLPVLAYDT